MATHFFPSMRGDSASLPGWAATLLAHGLVLLFLLSYAPARAVLATSAPLMVELIKPELPAPTNRKPLPKIELPKPAPVTRVQPQAETTLLAAQTPAAAAELAVAPEPKPAPPVESRPASPAPIIPPNFNAAYLDNPAPAYPALSRRMGEQGTVLLRVLVESDGHASKVEIRASSGFERLDQSALDAVGRWKFVPAKQGDQTVGAWVVVPILFSLRG